MVERGTENPGVPSSILGLGTIGFLRLLNSIDLFLELCYTTLQINIIKKEVFYGSGLRN